MDFDSESIASLVFDAYSSLRFRPPAQQYTILSGFVLSCCSSGKSKVISIATGSKCLPKTRLSPHGDSLNDSHAEVLARRGAIRWLLEEAQRTNLSQWIVISQDGKYDLRPSVKLHMYISTLPCGDASTRYLAFHQDEETALLKDSKPFPDQALDQPWRGRDNYHCFGVLRTKPGRADSPPTVSMSCSDKIASWNVLGIQGALCAQMFLPVYISSIVIGEVEENTRDVVKGDCSRALWGRIPDLKGLPRGYRVNCPAVAFSSMQFVHSLNSLSKVTPASGSCKDSLCWVADSTSGNGSQVLINGLKRGVSPKNKHNPKYRPILSKLSLYKTFRQLSPSTSSTTYFDCKQTSRDYQLAKRTLFGSSPFTAWIRNGAQWQSFDLNGNSC